MMLYKGCGSKRRRAGRLEIYSWMRTRRDYSITGAAAEAVNHTLSASRLYYCCGISLGLSAEPRNSAASGRIQLELGVSAKRERNTSLRDKHKVVVL